MNTGNVDPRAEAAHCVQPRTRFILVSIIKPAQLHSCAAVFSFQTCKKSQLIKEAPHSRTKGDITNCGLVSCVINGLHNRKQRSSVKDHMTIANVKPLVN